MVHAHTTQIIELLNMRDYTSQTECAVDVDKPIFQPFPAVVEFAHYAPFEPVTARLSFRNNDRFSRRMKVIPPESPYFSIEGPLPPGSHLKTSTLTSSASVNASAAVKGTDSRIAPGTEVTYIVTFRPQAVDDYAWDLVATTERERFVVPLRAVGSRPLLAMPDTLSFPSVPVKSKGCTKTIVIRNHGSVGASFEFSVEPGSPFTLKPSRGVIGPKGTPGAGDAVPVVITCVPLEAREYDSEVRVSYTSATGAGPYVCWLNLNGAGTDLETAVRLSAPQLGLEPTYVSLESAGTVKLINKRVEALVVSVIF
jgi:hydrocephalus-inducing protein